MVARARAAWLALAGSLAAGCTLVVADAERRLPAPCAAPGDCLAGTACRDGACVPVPRGAPPSPADAGPLDEAGGVLRAPGGARVELPPGALPGPVVLAAVQGSASTLTPGVQALSRPLEVAPALALLRPAVVVFPDAPCDAPCAVFTAPADGGPWLALPAAPAGEDEAAGSTSQLGVFVVGRPLPPPDAGADGGDAPADGGDVDDGGSDGGPAPADGGASDGGAVLDAAAGGPG